MATRAQTDIALRCIMQEIHDRGLNIHDLVDSLGCKMNTSKADFSNYVRAFDHLLLVAGDISPTKRPGNTNIQTIEDF